MNTDKIELYLAVFCLVLAVVHAVELGIREYRQRKSAEREKEHKGGIANGGWKDNINKGERVFTTEQLREIHDTLADTHAQRNEAKEQAMLNYQQVQEALNKAGI